MALISCPKCRKQISSEATACRHCGRARGQSLQEPGSKPKFAAHFLLSTVMAASGAFMYIAGVNGALDSPLAAKAGPYLLMIGIIWYVGARIWSAIVR